MVIGTVDRRHGSSIFVYHTALRIDADTRQDEGRQAKSIAVSSATMRAGDVKVGLRVRNTLTVHFLELSHSFRALGMRWQHAQSLFRWSIANKLKLRTTDQPIVFNC